MNTSKNITHENLLYNNILLLSRNKLFYTEINLSDTFQNRIHLIFIHLSFLFIKVKKSEEVDIYKSFNQKMFDLVFKKIELNMREIGFGDTVINKNMKFLVKNFFNILLSCENLHKETLGNKKLFFSKYLNTNFDKKSLNNDLLLKYFDKYQAFCFDLSSDSVLRGELNFNFK